MPTLDLDRESYYNDMGIGTLWTGDVQQSLDIAIDVRPPVDVEEIDSRRRGFERYDVTENLIRAAIHTDPRAPMHVGRVINASVTGMYVETKHALPFRSSVIVEWSVMGYSQTFEGRVVRHGPDGMAIHLETFDDTWRFRSSFIDLARTPTDDPPKVTIRLDGDHAIQAPDLERQVLDGLRDEWSMVRANYEDDVIHQDFINKCIKERRLQYALECYREIKTKDPECEIATKHLKQIGTILSFYTLVPKAPLPESGTKKYLPIVVVVAVVFAVLMSAPAILEKKMQRPVTAPPTIEQSADAPSDFSKDSPELP